jgi:Flp pilus assembly protein TadB
MLEWLRGWQFPTERTWLTALGLASPLLVWWLLLLLRRVRGSAGAFWQQVNAFIQGQPVLGQRRYQTWADQLNWADLPFRPAELYLTALACFLGGTLLLHALLGLWLLALLAGTLLASLPFVQVRRLAERRKQLLVQLTERLCLTLAGEIENNATTYQLYVRAARAKAPLGPIFAQVVADVRGGSTDREALEAVLKEQQHPVLERLIGPLLLLVTKGSEVTPLLRSAAEDIRKAEQRRIQLELRLAQARYQFWIVALLVVPMLLVLHWAAPATVELFLSFPLVLYFISLVALTLLIYRLVIVPRTRADNLYQHLGEE